MSVLSNVVSLVQLPCSQIWNIEKEKDREKEKVDDRPAKLNKKRGDRQLEQEMKKDIFCWKNNKTFCSGGEKTRNASGYEGENEQQ